jgi:transposase
MNATTTYAVDTAKTVFQLHWVDPATGEISRRKLTRTKFIEFFAQRQPARVVMEACSAAHHWARTLMAMGHQVELLPPHQVRPFVRGNKDDAADAQGLWMAASQPGIRRVPVKSVQQQAVLSLHRLRSHWVNIRTATVNNLRGLLGEFGVQLPRGRQVGLRELALQRAQIDARLPATMVQALDHQLLALQEIERHVLTMEQQLQVVQRTDETAKRLRKTPGIGLLGATGLAAALGDGRGWRNGREFACCLGLVPRHTGTGGKVRLGSISKRGDPYLRNLLISGARSVASRKCPAAWIQQMLARRPFNVVVVAVAHKLARIAWALVAHGRSYTADWQSQPPAHAAA